MDTNILQVEWLGDEHTKQEVHGSTTDGRKVCFSCEKSLDFSVGLLVPTCRYGCAGSKTDIDGLFEPVVIWISIVVGVR